MNAIKTALALVAYSLALVSHASDIMGRVTLKDTPPPQRAVDLKLDAVLAAKFPNGLTTRHYQVSRDGGLQNVLVYVRGSFDGVTFEPPRTSPVLDHVDGLFQPYVMGIRVGQQLRLKCSDDTICTFTTFAKANQDFAISPGPGTGAPGEGTVRRTFANPEVPIRFKCDLHPWNSAYLGVFAHPYFAVTDEQGRFTIPGVPAGQYSVEMFHPTGGWSAKPIVVTDKATTVDFEVTSQKIRLSLQHCADGTDYIFELDAGKVATLPTWHPESDKPAPVSLKRALDIGRASLKERYPDIDELEVANVSMNYMGTWYYVLSYVGKRDGKSVPSCRFFAVVLMDGSSIDPVIVLPQQLTAP